MRAPRPPWPNRSGSPPGRGRSAALRPSAVPFSGTLQAGLAARFRTAGPGRGPVPLPSRPARPDVPDQLSAPTVATAPAPHKPRHPVCGPTRPSAHKGRASGRGLRLRRTAARGSGGPCVPSVQPGPKGARAGSGGAGAAVRGDVHVQNRLNVARGTPDRVSIARHMMRAEIDALQRTAERHQGD